MLREDQPRVGKIAKMRFVKTGRRDFDTTTRLAAFSELDPGRPITVSGGAVPLD
jgi:hypothetical protein